MRTITRWADDTQTTLVATSTYTDDGMGRLTGLNHDQGSTPLDHYTFAYDAAGNMISTTSVWTAQGTPHTDTTGFTAYDAKNELESVTHTNQPNESYLFDANGNRTNGGRSTGPNNELTSDGIYNYTYDGEGNLVKQVTILTGAVEDCFWDPHNQLIGVDFKASATATASETISYTNDFLGRRIRKTVTSGSQLVGTNGTGSSREGEWLQPCGWWFT